MTDKMPAPQSSWRIGLAWGHIIRIVPAQESSLRGRNAVAMREVMFGPELMRPQIVERFDFPVVVRFVLGGEQHFDAHIQTQSDGSAQHMRVSATVEHTFMVKLGQVRHAQRLPRLQQVLSRRVGALVGSGSRKSRIAKQIHGRKGLHRFASLNPARDDVGSLHRIGRVGGRMGAIRVGLVRWVRIGQAATFHDTLKGAQTRHRFHAALDEFAPNGA